MSELSRIVSRKLVCAPVTALSFLTANLLLVAQGPLLKIYDTRRPGAVLQEQRVLKTQRIHVLVRDDASNQDRARLLVVGGKEIASINVDIANLKISTRCYWKANDWILAAAFLADAEVLLVTSHNAVQQYAFNKDAAELVKETHCIEKPLLWSATFTRCTYNTLEDVLLAVGTIMNEILVWRPFANVLKLERRLIGHTGSVFFVSFAPFLPGEGDLRCLASGSDDRDVRIWRWRDGAEDQVEEAVLRGHTHRPWRAAWTADGEALATAGEDLRCFLWATPQDLASHAWPTKPSRRWKGHEGKNIWSIGTSSDDNVIATGGSDGAVRLWSTGITQEAKIVLETLKDPITTFTLGKRHIVAISKTGNVYGAQVGSPHFQILHKLDTGGRPVQAVLAISEAADSKDDAVYIAMRSERIVVLPISAPSEVVSTQHDLSPLAIATRRKQGRTDIALFDRRRSRIAILAGLQERPLDLVITASSPSLQTERNPIHLCWLNDTTLILADSIASVWIYRHQHSTVEMICESRLDVRGTVSISANSEEDCCHVGNTDACITYRLHDSEGKAEIQFVLTVHLNYGIVKQVLQTADITHFLCTTNTSAQIADSTGTILASFSPPASSSATLQVSRTKEAYEFYSTSSQGLHHYSHPLEPAPVLQPGLHGREIWSVDLHQLENGSILCATNAEDANLKISLVRPKNDSFVVETLYRWPDVDGALQNVRWSSCDADNRALLFAEQHIDESVKREGTRIMVLDVLALGAGQHILLAGHSDGSLKWWQYNESSLNFKLLGRTAWHDRCLLSVRIIPDETDPKAIFAATAATDGRIAIWHILWTEENCSVLERPLCCFEAVHQSGINCLDLRQEAGILSLVSGGDDNAISYRRFSMANGKVEILGTATRHGAHSSSLKGIAFMSSSTFVSTSTDQRAIAWSIEDGGLHRTSSVVTHVADVSDLSILRTAGHKTVVAVCGLGMELLEV